MPKTDRRERSRFKARHGMRAQRGWSPRSPKLHLPGDYLHAAGCRLCTRYLQTARPGESFPEWRSRTNS